MSDERIVFLMEQQPGSVRIVATGEVTHDMLDAIMGFVHRARKRKDNFQEAAPEIGLPPCPPPKPKTWGDYYADARAAGMDDASACHAADTAVP